MNTYFIKKQQIFDFPGSSNFWQKWKIFELDTIKDHPLAWESISFSFCESGKKSRVGRRYH